MTAAYAQVQESRTLVDSTVNTVIAEIREASTTADTAWISQPGLIRTFDASGNEATAYKLYSAAEMIVPAGFNPAANLGTEVPADWLTRTTEFVDLNEPVTVDGDVVFPILDPAAEGIIEGFKNQVAATSVATSAENPMPMPVRWLYVLEDGTYRPKIGNTIAGATADNKPVARVAFWTDDESCKININTASSGDYWDTPRGRGTRFEKGEFGSRPGPNGGPTVQVKGLASSPPGNREYQRFPGHPATTSLDLVLNTTTTPFLSGSSNLDRRKQIFEITPRIGFTGSELGTKYPLASDPRTTDQDRLYATVDEMFYKPGRGTQLLPSAQQNLARAKFFLTANSRSPETTLFNTPRISIWPVDANSANRTPFDKVIAFCATVDDEEYFLTRTGFNDGALPSSIISVPAANGGTTSVFGTITNQAALSPSLDFSSANLSLYDYAEDLMDRSVPGYGASLNSRLGADGPQVLTEIFDYIRTTNLYDLSDSASDPYTARPWYLNEAQLLGYSNVGPKAGAIGDFPRPRDLGAALHYYGSAPFTGIVLPIRHSNDTQGIGRAPVIAGVTLVLMATEPRDLALKYQDPAAVPRVRKNPPTPPDQDDPSEVQAFLIVAAANPSPGGLPMIRQYEVRVDGLQNLTATIVGGSGGGNLGFEPNARNHAYRMTVAEESGAVGPFWRDGFSAFEIQNISSATPSVTELAKRYADAAAGHGSKGTDPFAYGLIGRPVSVGAGATGIEVNGSLLSVELLVAGQVVQTAEINLEGFTAPLPRWTNDGNGSGRFDDTLQDRFELGDRQYNAVGNFPIKVPRVISIDDIDVARGIALDHGDYRLAGASADLRASAFSPVPGYTDPTRYQAHNLRLHPKASYGQLVSGVSVGDSDALIGLPPSVNGATRSDGQPGDWDAGIPSISVYDQFGVYAGAMTNKTDDAAAGYRNETGNLAIPFFQTNAALAIEQNAFSPNRLIASPVMFGSLPAGVKRNRPWETLLFRPNYPTHPGAGDPPDHLILDLFWMPVVEPYPISEPFSTAGKVNLNQQIAPFTYIERTTAFRALLSAVRMIGVPQSNAYLMATDAAGTKFSSGAGNSNDATNYRYPIDRDGTATLLLNRLARNEPFISGSALCELPLVPRPEDPPRDPALKEPSTTYPFTSKLAANAPASAVESYVQSFWNANSGTADNLRERPYVAIYPRVTTQSNTYTVHVWTQTLTKSKTSGAGTFDPDAGDAVGASYRGSVQIERFLDTGNTEFNRSDPSATLGPYLFRVTNATEFSP